MTAQEAVQALFDQADDLRLEASELMDESILLNEEASWFEELAIAITNVLGGIIGTSPADLEESSDVYDDFGF